MYKRRLDHCQSMDFAGLWCSRVVVGIYGIHFSANLLDNASLWTPCARIGFWHKVGHAPLFSARILPRIPITSPDEGIAPPMCSALLLPTWTKWAIAHPEGPTTIDARLLGEHGLARLIMLAFGSDRLSEQLAPSFLGLERRCLAFNGFLGLCEWPIGHRQGCWGSSLFGRRSYRL